MKTKFRSDEIAHIWAHKSAPYGTSPGAMSFNGPAFLSYSTELARHITFKGKGAIVYNVTSYSSSTAKHQGKLGHAIPSGVQVFYIGNLERGASLYEFGGKELFNYAVQQAANAAKHAATARQRKGMYEADQAKWMERAQAVNEFFGLRRKVDGDAIRRLRESSARAEKAARAAQEKREALERETMAAGYAAWLKDEPGEYFRPSLFPVAFRVEGEELVSTLGARVPLEEAKRAFRFALAARARGWHRNGETCPVGNYQLDAVNENGVVAGCHRITWTEVERLAAVLA